MEEHYQPIWVSSISHLDEHTRITKSTSWFGKAIGRFDCPPEFPQIKLLWGALGGGSCPLVYSNYGGLTVENGAMSFVSTKPQSPGGRVNGHFPSLRLQLTGDQVKSIELYRYPDPYMRWANLDWVRIQTREDTLGGDFLMCVGGSWVKTINERTAQLLDTLRATLGTGSDL